MLGFVAFPLILKKVMRDKSLPRTFAEIKVR
jgi:hypothetical protein